MKIERQYAKAHGNAGKAIKEGVLYYSHQCSYKKEKYLRKEA
jgi:hypothetical protein